MARPVFDPATSAPTALAGRVVTMDAARTVMDDAVLYLRDGSITAVSPAAAPPPPGFESVPVTNVRGTIFPGLIELHNHLPYGVLQLWQVHRLYSNRADTNHRYVGDTATRTQMEVRGWVAEGDGPETVTMCAPV